MQINNFYADPVPSVRNPLDSIVLSPHTMGTDDVSLAQMEAATSDYRSVLPSIQSCEYHDQGTRRETKSLLRYIGKWCRQLNRRCGHCKKIKQLQSGVAKARWSRTIETKNLRSIR